MAIAPHITFKAGLCEIDNPRIKPLPTPGYIYLYTGDDDLLHFCWRPRDRSTSDPELDLIMFPTDGTFKPYEKHGSKFKPASESDEQKPVTNGRMFVLRFMSSSHKHVFWLQSRSQDPSGNPSHFSARDLKLGEIVNELLKGETVDVGRELRSVPNDQGGPDGDDDTAMEDADGAPGDSDHHRAASGGAGAGATGGDVREEGEEAREGGADGGRANAPGNAETQAAVANFLKSIQGSQALGGQQSAEGKLFTTLSDLLQPETTLPVLETADEDYIDSLLSHLPPTIIMLSAAADESSSMDPDPETVQAIMMSLELSQKKEILRKVLRSPQFSQSLGSLTMALRDGGLPTISEALKVKVENGGYLRRGGVPLGGGDAVEAFLKGVKSDVEENVKDDENRMDTQ